VSVNLPHKWVQVRFLVATNLDEATLARRLESFLDESRLGAELDVHERIYMRGAAIIRVTDSEASK
jgi:hypothetical protein